MKLKMKGALVALVMVVAVAMLPGCATNGAKPIPPAQVFAIACPPINAAIGQFIALDATMPTVPAAQKAAAQLAQLQPVVAAACSNGATVSTATVQEFAQTVLPALGQIAGSLPLKPAQLAQIQAGLVAAEIAVGTVGAVEAQIKAAQAPASGSTAGK